MALVLFLDFDWEPPRVGYKMDSYMNILNFLDKRISPFPPGLKSRVPLLTFLQLLFPYQQQPPCEVTWTKRAGVSPPTLAKKLPARAQG